MMGKAQAHPSKRGAFYPKTVGTKKHTGELCALYLRGNLAQATM